MASKSSKAVVAYKGKQNGITCNNVGAKGKQSNSYERTAKATCVDKHTGAYAYSATKVVMEHSITKIWRVGDESGYSEHQVQERFRRVDYGGNSSNKGNGSNLMKCSSSSNGKIIKKDSSSARHNSNTRGGSDIRVRASASAKGSSNKANVRIKVLIHH